MVKNRIIDELGKNPEALPLFHDILHWKTLQPVLHQTAS
jgi:hypothetical protein